MKRRLAALLLMACSLAGAEQEMTFENTNFTLTLPVVETDERAWYNYNRFRITAHVREENWFATAIGDLQHHLGRAVVRSDAFTAADALRSDTPFATRTEAVEYGEGRLYGRLYRLYGGYADERHRVSAGLQKISMGVGRIWNPTDLFNPKNPLALEPDEVDGVFALAYTYAPGTLSQIGAVAAQRADGSFKYAARAKGYLSVADAALNAIEADDVRMVGYELEGELMSTGVELRSEGGWFEDKLLRTRFFQGVAGGDYTFENTLSVTLEWLYTSRTFEREPDLPAGAPDNRVRSRGYGGAAAGYEFDPLLYGIVSAIISARDGSFYLAPALRYSLDDDMSLGVGGMFYGGEPQSEFGSYGQSGYVNLRVTF